jgi:hypothetical protein
MMGNDGKPRTVKSLKTPRNSNVYNRWIPIMSPLLYVSRTNLAWYARHSPNRRRDQMTFAEKERAEKLVRLLEKAGENHGLLVLQGHLVIRNGVNLQDAPMMMEVADLENAIALNLLQKHVAREIAGGKASWEWYMAKPRPKAGHSIIFKDGKRRIIEQIDNGVAFYGRGNTDIAPLENLVPASNGERDCWQIDSTIGHIEI